MIAVLAHEWRRLFGSPWGWILLSLVVLVSAWRFLAGVDAALFKLEQQTELTVSVTRAVVLPVLAQTAVLVVLLAGMFAARLWSADRSRGTDRFWLSAPLSARSIVIGQWAAVSGTLVVAVVAATVIGLSARLGAPIDVMMVMSGLLGLMLLSGFAVAVAGAVSAATGAPLIGALVTLLILLGLWAPDAAALARGADSTLLSWISISRRLHAFLNGEVAAAHAGFFLAGTAAGLASWAAIIHRGPRLRRLARALGSVLVAVLVVVGLERVDWRWDWTQVRRHTLSEHTRQLLSSLEGPVEVLAPAASGVPRTAVAEFFDRIRRVYPGLSLEWVDPGEDPERAQRLALAPDEVLIRYDDRETRLKTLAEGELVNAIVQLGRSADFRIAYAYGSGERDLRGAANHDWGRFGAELAQAGMEAVPLDFVINPVVPKELDLLIVAAGDGPPIPGAAEAIVDYVAAGGRLWWLADPGTARHYGPLLEHLGLTQYPGTVLDARAESRGIDDPRFLMVPRYPAHPVTRDFAQPTLFPIAAAWRVAGGGGWAQDVVVESGPASWNETGAIAGQVQPDGEDERRGPLALSLALENGRSRVLVVGDGDFLSNRFLGNGGNADLGLRMVRWLLADEAIAIPVRREPDRHLSLSQRQVGLLGVTWLVALPGLLLAVAGWRWWRRRA